MNFIIKYQKIFKIAGAALFWVALWYIIAIYVDQELLVPTPLRTLETLFEMGGTNKFWISVGSSMLRILGGFAAGMLFGCILGFLSCRISVIKWLLDPLIEVVRAAPVASFIVLALVWIKTNMLPAFISFFMVMPVFYSNIQSGYGSIDKKMVELCDVMKLGRRDRFTAYLKPALLPSFRAASVNGIGLAWKSGVAAEVICRPHFALGTLLGNGKNTLETAEVFAVTLVIILISMIFNMLIKRLWGDRNDKN